MSLFNIETPGLDGPALGLYRACELGIHNLIQPVIEAGADPNTLGARSFKSLLSIAVARRHTERICKLIALGADVATHAPGGPLLYFAASSGKLEIVEMLLKTGIDINQYDGYYGDPLIMATACNDETMIRKLVDSGAIVNVDRIRNTIHWRLDLDGKELSQQLTSRPKTTKKDW
ncbi:uncharacterized protein PAC_05825 [Phialocephala subalpina]|uniref:Uncharacterized protein n=1 Tax=Phialocephala subalpina TaxID=576137 RepID=A0A1L7WT47_9HELO|nr:uncharacterized protein PAC_05825 [Phialocephala subalpina]